MTQEQRIRDLITALGTDYKLNNTKIGNVNSLNTADKTVVGAINEVKVVADAATGGGGGGATINDTTPSGSTVYSSTKVNQAIAALINDAVTVTGTTWSSNKIQAVVNAAVASLVGSAPATLDTLQELAAALGDANAITAINTALGNRVRYDASQTLTAPQKTQARANIDAYGSVELGNPDVDLVALYNIAKA